MSAQRKRPLVVSATRGALVTRRGVLQLAAAVAGVRWLPSCQHVPPDLPTAVLDPVTDASSELTFFVTADPHFGADGLVERNRRQIRAMHELPGTPMPEELGGTVGRPSAVLVAGDLTDFGTSGQWAEYLEHYGPGGLLGYPVYECTGNHDRFFPLGSPALDGVRARHGDLLYGAALGPLRVISLDLYPDTASQEWLARQLGRIGRGVPVVLFFHYTLAGHFSDWWSEQDKDSLARVIQGYSIAAIFHGHAHDSRHYVWRGHDVYNVGSPRHAWNSFAVVHVAKGVWSIASWDWKDGLWVWWHRKELAAAMGGERPAAQAGHGAGRRRAAARSVRS